MKHICLLLFAAITTLLTGCNQVPQTDPDPRVWNNPPAVSYSHTFHNGGWDFTILKVELGDTATTVQMRVSGYSGQFYTFAQGTTLKADGKSYKLLSIDGLIPGQYKPLSKSRHEDLTFHFEPMPATTTSFDLLESETNPGAFNVYGIHKYNPDSKAIINTHWRNLRTGDWVISFLDSCVIYDCKVWNYLTRPNSETAAVQTIVVEQDDQVASIMISPLKHGKRTFRIQAPDGPKQFSCSAFDSRNLPDYPKIARRAYKLVDYGYDDVDTVTVSGFLIGPGRSNASFTIDVIDPIAAANPNFVFKTDANGYFHVRFPLTNTSVSVVRGNRISGFSIPVEPGQTYFVYENVLTGQDYVMGDNSRVQNDFITYSKDFYVDYDRLDESPFGNDTDAYLDYLIQTRSRHLVMLDSLLKVHPSLTEAFFDMSRAYANLNLYENIGQARFPRDNRPPIIPERMMKFLQDDIRKSSFKPYSLYYDFNYFLRDFVGSMTASAHSTFSISLSEMTDYAIRNGKITLEPDELEMITWYGRINDKLRDIISELGTDNQRIADTLAVLIKPEEQNKMEQASQLAESKGIWKYVDEYAQKIMVKREMDMVLAALDTLGFDKQLNDIILSHYLIGNINSSRHSVPTAILNLYDSIVTDIPSKNVVHRQNDKYLALENVDLASLGNDVSPEDLAGMSDGEQILRKITEPYRGKIVYIDVWGSWCHPCLENLEHAGELKEALKYFDIVYLYLASGTSDSAWKGVIKEYNLAGPNCVHYNLPGDQQVLVEQFLKVTSYPTYRLLNRNGALLDVSCHPGNLPALIETLKKL